MKQPPTPPVVLEVDLDLIDIDEEFAAKLPPMNKEKFEAFKADIKARTMRVPVLLSRDNLLLDGHRRYDAAKALGLKTIPARILNVRGTNWEDAILDHVNRKHLTPAQLAAMGTSLERIERQKAKNRMAEGGRKAAPGRPAERKGGEPSTTLSDEPKKPRRATEAVAKAVGVSRATYEKTKTVLEHGDEETKKRLMDANLSVSSAFKKTKRKLAKEKADEDIQVHVPGIYRGAFEEIPKGAYRCIYNDPPWRYDDSGIRGAAEGHYETLSIEGLAEMPLEEIAHPDGCHLWLWTTWPMIRDEAPHEIIEFWGFRWVGEVIWKKTKLPNGHWLRPITEVLILAVKGDLPLLVDNQAGFFEAPQQGHSVKPQTAREIVERCSPGPRIELFGRHVPEGWDGWGNQCRRVS